MEKTIGVVSLSAEAIKKANFDLGDRLEVEEIKLEYNPEADVLVITIGDPVPAITEPVIDDIMYRVEPDTLKVVGVEIVAFFSDFVRHNKIARKLLKGYTDDLLSARKEVQVRVLR